MFKKKKSPVKKVKKFIEYDGHKFRSGLEISCYKLLKEANIDFGYESKTFLLQEAFTFPHETYEKVGKKGMFLKFSPKIRKIEHTPDFSGKNWVIETKGFIRASNANIIKMFKKHILDNNLNLNYYMAYNIADIKECIKLIKKL